MTVKLPIRVALQPANDNPAVTAITYGPAVLAGNYGSTTLSSPPVLDPSSIGRTSSTALNFMATANGTTVGLAPFHDAQGFNHTVYWRTESPGFRLVNATSGLVLGIRDMSTADGAPALQWADTGTADVPPPSGERKEITCSWCIPLSDRRADPASAYWLRHPFMS